MKNTATAAVAWTAIALTTAASPIAAAEVSSRVGATIEAESLNRQLSANYHVAEDEVHDGLRYVGYVDGGSVLCYDDVDLTGVRSIALEYARGIDDPGRFGILAVDDSGLGPRTNLGEADSVFTDGWNEYASHRVGLSREIGGVHSLCLFGVEGGGIFNLDRFTLSDKPGENDGVTVTFDTAIPPVLSAAGHEFTLEKVAEVPTELWAMAFLPDSSLVTTQKNGWLLLVRQSGEVVHIEGTPAVWNRSQGGLLDVQPHPDYESNGWLYLTFSDVGDDDTTMTRVVRGRIAGHEWVDQEDIYVAPRQFYSEAYAHFGSRLAFAGGYVYFGIGDRMEREQAQDLGRPNGKIHRLHADGTVPEDNPFAGDASALPSIWSYGHRNPQGMTVRPADGSIWSAEHGPAGGDEVNLLRKGRNYGWPLVSFGIHYDGTPVSDSPYREGIEPPVHHWTPSIGVSQVEFYTGDVFPGWRGHLFAASLGRQRLHLLRIDGDEVTGDELLFQGLGRIRDVTNGPDGSPYVVLNGPNGTIYRLVPEG